MWLVVILVAGVFLLTGFGVNAANARYLLAGYNTMSEERRRQFDLEGYLVFFRKFFLLLGLAMLLGFALLQWWFTTEVAFIYFVVLPLLAFPYLLLKSRHFEAQAGTAWKKASVWGIALLLIVLLGLGMMFYRGLSPNHLTLKEGVLLIEGMYGEQLPYADIQQLALTEQLPVIRTRTNGFALGRHRKGYFRTRTGEKVKLLLSTSQPPFLKISTSRATIYWNTPEAQMLPLLRQLQDSLP